MVNVTQPKEWEKGFVFYFLPVMFENFNWSAYHINRTVKWDCSASLGQRGNQIEHKCLRTQLRLSEMFCKSQGVAESKRVNTYQLHIRQKTVVDPETKKANGSRVYELALIDPQCRNGHKLAMSIVRHSNHQDEMYLKLAWLFENVWQLLISRDKRAGENHCK